MKNMSGSGSFPIWRLSPEPWIGLATPYDPEFNKVVLANAVETRAFDKQSKTWWMPRSYEPVVTSLVLENKKWSVPQAALDQARADIYRDKVLLHGESVASDYAVLGLHPSAPPGLIEWGITFWRNVYRQYGAPTTHLMQVEEAYGRIMARVAAATQQPQAPVAPGQPRRDQG